MSTRIEVDRLLQVAQRNNGLQTLGDASDLHLEGWRRLASAIERNHYDARGLFLATQDFLHWIEAYLRFERDLVLYPEIRQVPVARPVFIVDFGRTGSTFLHHLLALDPRARAPRLWELWQPSPPPRPESCETDERIELARKRLESLRKGTPAALDIHPLEAQAPEECQWMMRHGTPLAMQHAAAEYWSWLKNLDAAQLGSLFSHYRLQVQHLQLFCRGEYWLSKSMSHLHYLPVLLDTFPDARVVRLHRNPCQILPSLCSLYASIRAGYSRRPAPRLGELMLDMFADGMRRMIELDARRGAQPFIDVFFSDLIGNPVSVVRRIYGHFGLAYTDRLAAAVKEQAQRFARAQQHGHAYSLEQFQLTREDVLARAGEYLEWLRGRTGVDLTAAPTAALPA